MNSKGCSGFIAIILSLWASNQLFLAPTEYNSHSYNVNCRLETRQVTRRVEERLT
jgi:hypothetical protein